jgi:hypothetical protein
VRCNEKVKPKFMKTEEIYYSQIPERLDELTGGQQEVYRQQRTQPTGRKEKEKREKEKEREGGRGEDTCRIVAHGNCPLGFSVGLADWIV